MTRRRQVDRLPEGEAVRQAYLGRFVDTACEHYRKYLATRRQFSDGSHYEGYIWDCLRLPTRITYAQFCQGVQGRRSVCAMADDHSRDRVIGPPLWPWPPNSVIALSGELLLQLLPALPEDIYVFDRRLLWTLVLTHEHEEKDRICLSVRVPETEGPTTGSN